MIGIVLVVAIFAGYAFGLTGLTYPLILLSLGLCASSLVSPWFAVAFGLLALAHHRRMRNPLYMPVFFSRSGFAPVIGVSCLLLTIVAISLLLGLNLAFARIATSTVFVAIGVLVVIVRREAARVRKMEALCASGAGERFWLIIEKTGLIIADEADMESKRARILETQNERDDIVSEIQAAGVDPRHFARYLAKQDSPGEYSRIA